MAGVNFIDLEEIVVQNEEQLRSEEEEQGVFEREELWKRFCQAKACYRKERELHDWMFEQGLQLEEQIKETAAQNKHLSAKIKELQQQVAHVRKMKEDDEEALKQQLLSQQKSQINSQLIYIRKKGSYTLKFLIRQQEVEDKENQRSRQENEELTAELNSLSLDHKHLQEHLRTVEQEYKRKLEEVQRVIYSQDEEIQRKSLILNKKNKEIEEYFNIMEDLRKDQRELRQELSSRQEEQILAAPSFQDELKMLSEQGEPEDSSPVDKTDEIHQDERPLKAQSWWNRCTKALWKGMKVTGTVTLCALLSVGVMVSVAPVCNNPDPDCNLWNIAADLLESYTKLCIQAPVF